MFMHLSIFCAKFGYPHGSGKTPCFLRPCSILALRVTARQECADGEAQRNIREEGKAMEEKESKRHILTSGHIVAALSACDLVAAVKLVKQYENSQGI